MNPFLHAFMIKICTKDKMQVYVDQYCYVAQSFIGNSIDHEITHGYNLKMAPQHASIIPSDVATTEQHMHHKLISNIKGAWIRVYSNIIVLCLFMVQL